MMKYMLKYIIFGQFLLNRFLLSKKNIYFILLQCSHFLTAFALYANICN